MSLSELIIDIPAEYEMNVFGQFDTYIKKIERRQSIFNQYDVNHINNYNKLFKNGEAEEPLPHLFLISDEFAELKKEQPEFMSELVSAARIGRSLGVHLILATQKPTGVVDDQIWSNSTFRLCLKVQNAADSKEMLHTADAANITQAGRGYLQVGNNEIYELFQSAWSGADYNPDGKNQVQREEHIIKDDLEYANEIKSYFKTYLKENTTKSKDNKYYINNINEFYKSLVDNFYNISNLDLKLEELEKLKNENSILKSHLEKSKLDNQSLNEHLKKLDLLNSKIKDLIDKKNILEEENYNLKIYLKDKNLEEDYQNFTRKLEHNFEFER